MQNVASTCGPIWKGRKKYTPPPWKPSFFLSQGLRPAWYIPFFPDLGLYPLPFFSQEDGIHHSFFCSVPSASGDRPRMEGCHSGGVYYFLSLFWGGARRMGGGRRTRERILMNILGPNRVSGLPSYGLLCTGKAEQRHLRGAEHVPDEGGSPKPFFGRGLIREVSLPPFFSGVRKTQRAQRSKKIDPDRNC